MRAQVSLEMGCHAGGADRARVACAAASIGPGPSGVASAGAEIGGAVETDRVNERARAWVKAPARAWVKALARAWVRALATAPARKEEEEVEVEAGRRETERETFASVGVLG